MAFHGWGNIKWQGVFHKKNTAEDGYSFASPVDALPAQNELGLHNMLGR